MQQPLRLTVPKVHESDQGTLYSDPHELAQILRNLPFADMPSAVMKSVNILSVINRSQISYQLRLKLMQAFDVPYGVCHLFYTPQCPEQLGIIRSRSLQEQDAFREFTQEMSYGYKEVLMDALAHNDKKRAFIAMFAAFYYMSSLLMLFYSVHQLQPLNIWGEMHRLYKLAEELEWTRMPQKYIALAKGMTLEWMYKKSLLMFTADPYHMETAQNWLLNHYLSKWSYCAELLPFRNGIDTPHFTIDLNRNNAICGNPRDTPNNDYLRTLTTDCLVATATKHIDQLHHGLDTHSLGFILNPNRNEAEEVLESAIDHWAQKFHRSEIRSRCTIPASMTIGLYHCHKDLSKSSLDDDKTLIEVKLIDSSPHGCCVRIAGNTQQEVIIGQLVVIHQTRPTQDQEPDTFAGIIRWVAQDKYKGSKIGVKFLPGQVLSGFVRSLSGSEIAQKTHPAIIVMDKECDRDYSIITSPGLYLCGRTYELNTVQPQRRYLIKASTLINHTRSLDHFKIHAAH